MILTSCFPRFRYDRFQVWFLGAFQVLSHILIMYLALNSLPSPVNTTWYANNVTPGGRKRRVGRLRLPLRASPRKYGEQIGLGAKGTVDPARAEVRMRAFCCSTIIVFSVNRGAWFEIVKGTFFKVRKSISLDTRVKGINRIDPRWQRCGLLSSAFLLCFQR